MPSPHPTGVRTYAAPTFYLTGRQPLSPAAILLAIVAVGGALCLVLYALGQTAPADRTADSSAHRSATTPADNEKPTDDDKDDPSQIDTIVLGDPADAPVPGRRGNHVSPVHPTILVHLPRFGEQAGLIPDTPAGKLLYGWLAAFNQTSPSALGHALPSLAPSRAVAAQILLRQQTGGFNLLSAREVQPGILVFRLRDQTPEGVETLGTLMVRPDSSPAAIASLSLRAIPSPHHDTTPRTAQALPVATQ